MIKTSTAAGVLLLHFLVNMMKLITKTHTTIISHPHSPFSPNHPLFSVLDGPSGRVEMFFWLMSIILKKIYAYYQVKADFV